MDRIENDSRTGVGFGRVSGRRGLQGKSINPVATHHGLERPIFKWSSDSGEQNVPMPELPKFVIRNPDPPFGTQSLRSGFSVRLALEIFSPSPTVIAENSGQDGSCFRLLFTEKSTLRIELDDSQTSFYAESDPFDHDTTLHSIIINVDGGSNTVSFFRNGTINDGGDTRQYGWRRFSPYYRNEFLGKSLVFHDAKDIHTKSMEIFGRILTAAEIVELDKTSLKN